MVQGLAVFPPDGGADLFFGQGCIVWMVVELKERGMARPGAVKPATSMAMQLT